jgi:DNA processing protein
MTAEHLAYNALAIVYESAYVKLRKLKQKYGTWETAWHEEARKDTEAVRRCSPQAEWEKLVAGGIQLLLREDPLYPPLLQEIPHPPHALYIKGPLPEYDRTVIAIVGTRRATMEGKESARRFARKLSTKQVIIASGLAFGIDTAAHKGALETKSPTVAVLAHGLHTVYPRSNAALSEKMLATGGTLISEYPLDAPPFRERFLERNRVVSGISRAVLLVEAPERSGSLATARFALEQNREVFALPGPATHPNFRGSHSLIREGAMLVRDPDDLLADLGIMEPHHQKNLTDIPEEERNIVSALQASAKPLTIDEILETTSLDPRIANQAITLLILRGIIREEGAGYAI